MKKLAVSGRTTVGKMNVPGWPIFDENDVKSVQQVAQSGSWGIHGTKKREFEAMFAQFCGTKYALAATNGTHTLRLALEALGIGPGDEVIVPGLTWQATAAVVLDVNAVPILVDIDPETYTIDPEAVEAAITSRTRCIMPVHLYGRMADMDAIMSIARKHNLYIVEDCAHQHGSAWRGKPAGSIGDIGSFSLQQSKILTCGEGGIITTNDERLYVILQTLVNCGKAVYDNGPAMQSGNYRIGEFQAAIAITQLSRLEEQNNLREKNARYLEEKIKDIEGLKAMGKHPGVTRQAIYLWTLRYDSKAWEGVSREIFTAALKAELEGSIDTLIPYEPLNNTELYKPLAKRTHKLSDEYCKAIDPARFDLPVCKKAFEEEGINFWHMLLLAEQKELDVLVAALKKLRENTGELVEYARKVQGE